MKQSIAGWAGRIGKHVVTFRKTKQGWSSHIQGIGKPPCKRRVLRESVRCTGIYIADHSIDEMVRQLRRRA